MQTLLNKVLLTDAVRFYEAQHGDQLQSIDVNYANEQARQIPGELSSELFKQRIFKRARVLDQSLGLQEQIQTLQGRSFLLSLAGLLGAFLLGFLSAQFLLLQQNDMAVNVYAVLLALLLPNLFSMILSVLMLTVKPDLKDLGIYALWQNIQQRFSIRKKMTPIKQAWQNVYLQEPFSKWWVARKTHALWLLFLVGSSIGLVWRLSVHQYFFGWESTLLPDGFFVSVTQFLAQPFTALQFSVPNMPEVIASNLKAQNHMQGLLSKKWALFILLCILLYAILPRIVLLLFSFVKEYKAAGQLSLDLNEVAYARLYDELMLHEESIGVVDPDEIGQQAEQHKVQQVENNTSYRLSENESVFSFELPEVIHSSILEDARFRLTINDRDTQQQALEQKAQLNKFVLIISLLSVPDRGTLRFIKQFAQGVQINLVFVHEGLAQQRYSKAVYSQRVFDWLQAMETLGINSQAIYYMDVSEQSLAQEFLALEA